MSRSSSRARAFQALRNKLPAGRNAQRMLLVSSLAVLALPLSAATVELNVTTTSDSLDPADGKMSLREAILDLNDNSYSGDDVVITIPAGTYKIAIGGFEDYYGAVGDFDLTSSDYRSLTLRGAATGATIIDGAGKDRVFDFSDANGATINVERLTIQNGRYKGRDGLDGLFVIGSSSGDGSSGSSATGGGIYFGNGSTITMTDVVVRNCVAEGGKGGDGDDLIVNPNGYSSAGDGSEGGSAYGGGIYASSSNVTLTRCSFLNNRAVGGSGGDGGNATAGDMPSPEGGDGSYGGSAYGGGAMIESPTSLVVEDCVFNGNKALAGDGGRGGDAAHATTSDASPGEGSSGASAYGGGLYVGNNWTWATENRLKNVTFVNNAAVGGDGGLGGSGWDSDTSDVYASDGDGGDGGSAYGGGMYSQYAGFTMITGDSSFTGNTAQGGTGADGGDASSAASYASAGDGGDAGSAYGGGLYFYGGTWTGRGYIQLGTVDVDGNKALCGDAGDGGDAHNGWGRMEAGDGGWGGSAYGGGMYLGDTVVTLTSGGPTFGTNVAEIGTPGLGGTTSSSIPGFVPSNGAYDGSDGSSGSTSSSEDAYGMPGVLTLVGDLAWRDVGGTADSYDTGTDTAIENVLVTLRDSSNDTLARFYTDVAGAYAFDTAWTGGASLVFAKPGEVPVAQDSGATDLVDSDIDSGGVVSISITSGDDDLTVDAGFEDRATSATLTLTITGTVSAGTTSVKIGSVTAVPVANAYTITVTVPSGTTELEMITSGGGASSSRTIHINAATTAGG